MLEPLTTEQGILNAGMFAPVGLLATLATRRAVGPLVGGFLLTSTIETFQGIFTFLGRGCDTSDLEMNFLGTAAGVTCGWLIVHFEDRGRKFWNPLERRNGIAAVASFAFLSVAWITLITPEKVDHTVGIGRADSQQRTAIEEAVRDAFGDHYEILDMQFAAGQSGAGTVMASFKEGFAELSWPDRRKFTASLDMSDTGQPSGFPVSGNSTVPANANDAEKIASLYARSHAAWGIKEAQTTASAVGSEAELGWMISWRRRDANGVLMPMRLDIQVDRTGRVSQLIMLDIPDPSVTSPSIAKADAVKEVLKQVKLGAPGLENKAGAELLAQQVSGQWRPCWLVTGKHSDTSFSGTVDAISGKVITSDAQRGGGGEAND
ncbi:VanZ family protein [Streptomyces sp. GC420]|uniref:VanZ family protein n=1 Tax=Streptomyces sp. GC420 TaxID=2697568 RepID=UPI0014152857|nr:VanZ family protein [Streptomyces sp. GC420]NBM17665.1 VanZ family protein [Streptomyces sp. GC420]